YGSAAEMLAALQGVLAEAEIHSRPATEMPGDGGPLPPPPRGVARPQAADTIPDRAAPRRLRSVLWSLVAVLLLVTAALVYFHGIPRDAAPLPPLKEPPVAVPGSRAGPFPNAIPRGGWPMRLGGNVRTVAFSPCNNWFAAGSLNRNDGNGDGGAAIWPRTPGAEGIRFLHKHDVRHLVFSPRGERLAA